jgi:hypothetical protein
MNAELRALPQNLIPSIPRFIERDQLHCVFPVTPSRTRHFSFLDFDLAFTIPHKSYPISHFSPHLSDRVDIQLSGT